MRGRSRDGRVGGNMEETETGQNEERVEKKREEEMRKTETEVTLK